MFCNVVVGSFSLQNIIVEFCWMVISLCTMFTRARLAAARIAIHDSIRVVVDIRELGKTIAIEIDCVVVHVDVAGVVHSTSGRHKRHRPGSRGRGNGW